MTLPEDDFDDFDFDDEFADEWDDDASDVPEQDAAPSDMDRNDKQEKEKKSSSSSYKIILLLVAASGVGVYFAYPYFLSKPATTIPVVKIEPHVENTKNAEKKSPADLDESQERDDITSSHETTELRVDKNDTVSSDTIGTISDDEILTPLPENIESMDIALIPLVEQAPLLNVADVDDTAAVSEAVSDIEGLSSAEVGQQDSSPVFDEQKILEKTEVNPEVEADPAAGTQDIFEHLETVSSKRLDAFKASENEESKMPKIEHNQELVQNERSSNAVFSNESKKKLISEPEKTHIKTQIKTTLDNTHNVVKVQKNNTDVEKELDATKSVERKKRRWKIKAVQPGKAVIRDVVSGAVKSVEVGQNLYETGLIQDIKKINGKWTIVGQSGQITQ